MSLKTTCVPRPSVFAQDRRATVLSLDTFLKGQVLAKDDPAPGFGKCHVVGGFALPDPLPKGVVEEAISSGWRLTAATRYSPRLLSS